jgi:hypothetical protein
MHSAGMEVPKMEVQKSKGSGRTTIDKRRYRLGQELAHTHRYRLRSNLVFALGYVRGWFRSSKSLQNELEKEAIWNKLQSTGAEAYYGESMKEQQIQRVR